MRSLVLLALLAACTREPLVAARGDAASAAPAASSAAAASPGARPTSCAARPATVYGSEPVLFAVEGEADPGASLAFELRDERGQRVTGGTTGVPGELRPADVPSGDFVLIVGDNLLRCAVTVNRELQRGSQMAR